jgi:hypothetical protein
MSQPDHADVISAEHASHPPARTVNGALAFLLHVIAVLKRKFPDERVGLLKKTAGENIVPYGGTKVSASRLVYPDHNFIVKVLTDVPTTNGPSWQTEQGIPNEGHHGGYLAVGSDEQPLPVTPSQPVERMALLESQVTGLEREVETLHKAYAALVQGHLGPINATIQQLGHDLALLTQRPAGNHTHEVRYGPLRMVTGPPKATE